MLEKLGEMSTADTHNVYFSGEEDRHEYGVEFLVHKGIITTYHAAITDAASVTHRKECQRTKSWIIKAVLDICGERRELKRGDISQQ